MKKRNAYLLLVDITDAVEAMDQAWDYGHFKRKYKDRFEVWKYIYDSETKTYKPFGFEDPFDRFSRVAVNFPAVRFPEDPPFEVPHYPSKEQAILHSAICGDELYVTKKMRNFPTSLTFSELKRTWKRAT